MYNQYVAVSHAGDCHYLVISALFVIRIKEKQKNKLFNYKLEMFNLFQIDSFNAKLIHYD